MNMVLWALLVLGAGGLMSGLFGQYGRIRFLAGAGAAVAASVLGLIGTLGCLLSGSTESTRFAWSMPYGSLNLELDALGAFFLIPVWIITAVAAVYGLGYFRHYEKKKNLGVTWLFYHLLTAGMVMVVLARNGLLFLVSWEIMSLASLFLVLFEDEKEQVSRAGWIYLAATHIGTAFLIAMFILLGHVWGSLNFTADKEIERGLTHMLFGLALVGFGTKAGFMPLHVWLPEAHPAAPSPVSAVMSGVMIKMGLYGLLRVTLLLGNPAAWWGWALLAIGVTSGIIGILFAIAQHDMKRLLAYSSVENIGIICLGLGAGFLGIYYHKPIVAVLGFAGALMHIWNHSLFKSLLFMAAGAVAHATGTRDLNVLGGLGKRMRVTMLLFFVGSAAIVGLPPLNGFLGEFMIYAAGFSGELGRGSQATAATLAIVGGLALIGGLALAALTKTFGMLFLGEPRSDKAAQAHEVGGEMLGAMALPAVLCVGLGLGWPKLIFIAKSVITQVSGLEKATVSEELAIVGGRLGLVVLVSVTLIGLAVFIGFARWLLLRRQTTSWNLTWDCGYAKPTARMSYTGSSFVEPLTGLFGIVLRSRKRFATFGQLFWRRATFRSATPDGGQRYLYFPLFRWIKNVVGRLSWLQSGRLQIYILYIALTLWVLLIWKLR